MPETRELVVSGTPYIVVYLISDDVELIRVLHGAQQWPPEN
jgi:toxin ParE1/3/4